MLPETAMNSRDPLRIRVPTNSTGQQAGLNVGCLTANSALEKDSCVASCSSSQGA